jgi:amino-acid N-acetyltransferase
MVDGVGVEVRTGRAEDLGAVRALLASAGLPVDDLGGARQAFVVALAGARLVGCVGVELADESCLLRSFAVAPDLRRHGIGARLHERAMTLAWERGARTAYLLTTTVAEYAARNGFERVERAALPPGIAALPQLRGICPASAACFRRRIDPPAG